MATSELERLVIDFTEAFNRDDLDAVIGAMSEDAIYDEYDGRRHVGKAAIRAAFEPQFRGEFGTIRFRTEDVFGDERSGKVLIRWGCEIEKKGRVRVWRGLDVIHVRDGQVVEKHTYAKAERLKLVEK